MKGKTLKLTPPPLLLSRTLTSSFLALLLCAGVEVNAITESNNQIIFANTGDTFTPSSGVYSVSSGDNKTIQISEGVEYANFKGGISVASGGTLNFSFAGMDSLTGSGLITSQNFNFLMLHLLSTTKNRC